MRRFVRLCAELARPRAGDAALAALRRYFDQAPPADAAWALQLLCGGRPLPRLAPAVLRQAACHQLGMDDWLFDACLQASGDLAETIALLLPEPAADAPAPGLAECLTQHLLPLRGLAPQAQAERLPAAWAGLGRDGRWLLLRLLLGGWRPGVSRLVLQRALAAQSGLEPALLAQRLAAWPIARRHPDAADLQALLAPPEALVPLPGRPWPLCALPELPAQPDPGAALGPAGDWQACWLHDGLRAQLVRRGGQAWLWSADEALLTPRLPEVAAWAAALPEDCVLDGLLLAWPPGAARPASRALLAARLERQAPARRRADEPPARFAALDLLECAGADQRQRPWPQRQQGLRALLAEAAPEGLAGGWAEWAVLRDSARAQGASGLLLQRRDAAYGQAGGCWHWPAAALTLDALLVYTEDGGDCSFAVWNRPPADPAEAQAALQAPAAAAPGALQLLPCARVPGALAAPDWAGLAQEIRALTLERFGPVRSLRPCLVFELAFEAVDPSPRHKSGLALRAPRLLRLRRERQPWQAGALPRLQALL